MESENAPVNPFQSPQSQVGDLKSVMTNNSWKEIAVRWERLRLPYNLLVGAVGLLGLLFLPVQSSPAEIVAGVIGWALGANICYLLGPILQMYACWFAESGLPDAAPSPAETLATSPVLTWVVFLAGTGFSVLLTLGMLLYESTLWM